MIIFIIINHFLHKTSWTVKTVHNNNLEHKLTSLEVSFCLTNSPKPDDIQFTIMEEIFKCLMTDWVSLNQLIAAALEAMWHTKPGLMNESTSSRNSHLSQPYMGCWTDCFNLLKPQEQSCHQERHALCLTLTVKNHFDVSFPAVWSDEGAADSTSSHGGLGDSGGRRWLRTSGVSPEQRLFPGLHRDSDRAPDPRRHPVPPAGLRHVWQTRGSVGIYCESTVLWRASLPHTKHISCSIFVEFPAADATDSTFCYVVNWPFKQMIAPDKLRHKGDAFFFFFR